MTTKPQILSVTISAADLEAATADLTRDPDVRQALFFLADILYRRGARLTGISVETSAPATSAKDVTVTVS